jgi:hypothetical protein
MTILEKRWFEMFDLLNFMYENVTDIFEDFFDDHFQNLTEDGQIITIDGQEFVVNLEPLINQFTTPDEDVPAPTPESTYTQPERADSDPVIFEPEQPQDSNTFDIQPDSGEILYVDDLHLLNYDVIGDPLNEQELVYQQEGQNSCAVATQKQMIESITGQDIPESELSNMATMYGWFHPDEGTYPEDCGKILEYYNIPVERTYETSFQDLERSLMEGEKVMIALNANEIWYPQYDEYGQPVDQAVAGHAVWVTGIARDDQGNSFVAINDSGTGEARLVPYEHFQNAWSDYDNYAVTTDVVH